MEDDQIEDHQHEDSGHQHDCSASSSAGSHSHNYVRSTYDKVDAHGGPDAVICASSYDECDQEIEDNGQTKSTTSASVSVSTSCSTSSHSSGIGHVNSAARSGTETRPLNMKVSYVMRCW